MGPTESTLLFCGALNAGKSSLLSRFSLDGNGRKGTATGNDQTMEPSVALEYSFVSKPRGTVSVLCAFSHLFKGHQMVHCWELAGGGAMANLLGVPLIKRNFQLDFSISS